MSGEGMYSMTVTGSPTGDRDLRGFQGCPLFRGRGRPLLFGSCCRRPRSPPSPPNRARTFGERLGIAPKGTSPAAFHFEAIVTVYEWANLRKAAKTGRFGKVWK